MAEANSKPIKAQRGVLAIGDIEINVYLLPNGSYRLAGRNVTDAVGMRHGSLAEIMGVKSLKALPHADASLTGVKADTGESFVPVAIEDAVAYWAAMSNKGNRGASVLLQALAIESIERRADALFGKVRDEAERDARLKARLQGKVSRTELEDAIAEYIKAHPETSENYRKWVYKNATDTLIRALWGKTRKALATDMGLESTDSLRDQLSDRELLTLDQMEATMARLITIEGMEPIAAAEEVVNRNLNRGIFATQD